MAGSHSVLFRRRAFWLVALALFGLFSGIAAALFRANAASVSQRPEQLKYAPRVNIPSDGYALAMGNLTPWGNSATLEDISRTFERLGNRTIEAIDSHLQHSRLSSMELLDLLVRKATLLNYEGDPAGAYDVLDQAHVLLNDNRRLQIEFRSTINYLQGVAALRRGENENCIMCRGESSCILPISRAARHINPEGSTLAIQHFKTHLEHFPDDFEAQWLMNLAHMTLGTYPEGVDPRFRIPLEKFTNSEFDIGRFRDIGHVVGVNQFTEAGGAIMDDFDNDGLLDIVITSIDPTENMAFLRNTGTGKFEDRTAASGLVGQLGGLNCVQTDYNNDGWLDIFVIRGAWLSLPMRPSLLRNNCDGTFSDVTQEAGVDHPVNSIAAAWGDYDNDGWLDLFVCGEQQPSRLYRNQRDNTFQEVSTAAGIKIEQHCKGATWIDYDNDGYQDLYVSMIVQYGGPMLFRNKHDGTFEKVTVQMGITGPVGGFSCWTWDYNNDGWLDIFSTCYERSLGDVVRGVIGQPNHLRSSCLYRNEEGRQFVDVAKTVGLGDAYATMGSNFADLDNDGFLDFYLGTGEPELATLIPNRMFRNVDGERFSEITASSGTGSLQKGHGVACGDWDRDGNVDVFIEMGGAIPGDKYHNILFQNPGHDNHWITVKLVGEKTNRAAIGARIKVVTSGDEPRTIHRHVSSGSSFGANPLEQTIGIGSAESISLLEIQWPTTGLVQQFRDISADQAIEITEFHSDFRTTTQSPIPVSLEEPQEMK